MMKAFSTLLVFLAVFTGIPEAKAASIEVHLKTAVEITEANIFLKDVVESINMSAREWDKISKHILGPAPLLGFERYFTREQIHSVLIHHGIDPGGVVFYGPQTIRAFVKGYRVEGAQIRVRAENFLWEELEKSGKKDFEVDCLGVISGVVVPKRKKPLAYRVRWASNPAFRGNVNILVQVLDGENVLGQVPIRFRVRAYDSVLVAKKKLARKTPLSMDDFELKRIEVTNFSKTPFRDPENLKGRELIRSVRMGSILAVEDTCCPPVVKRGDLVTVTVINANLVLTAKAKAKENGKKGDWIAVENIDTRRLILARITGPYRVEVIMSER